MKQRWFVVDNDGNMSWSEKLEGPESFKSYKAAEKRARELAEVFPGEDITIATTIATVGAAVGAIKVKKA